MLGVTIMAMPVAILVQYFAQEDVDDTAHKHNNDGDDDDEKSKLPTRKK
jgi:hypothetical protein